MLHIAYFTLNNVLNLPKMRGVFLNAFFQVLKTNQFSVTRHEKVANGLIGDQGLPGVFVLYELSPMMVKFTEKHRYEGPVLHSSLHSERD